MEETIHGVLRDVYPRPSVISQHLDVPSAILNGHAGSMLFFG